ncbi:hypothetical protein ACF0H5_003488 [Mactra antiquata]
MAAPMSTEKSLNKKTLKYVVLGHLLSTSALLALVYVSLNGILEIDIISYPLNSIKVLMTFCLIIHGCLHFFIGSIKWQKQRLGLWIKDVLKCFLIFSISVMFFHCVAILFGAPFAQKSAETFHFAMILSTTTVAPLIIHLWTDFDAWFRVIIFQSPDIGIESMLNISFITSILGAWLGALPVPLDWDRPWQVWPITCVIGTLLGHCVGMMISSIYTCTQFNKRNKYKLT